MRLFLVAVGIYVYFIASTFSCLFFWHFSSYVIFLEKYERVIIEMSRKGQSDDSQLPTLFCSAIKTPLQTSNSSLALNRCSKKVCSFLSLVI